MGRRTRDQDGALHTQSGIGQRARFMRNEQLLNLKPVHAVVCEGSGIQSNLLTRVREANVPYHAFAIRHQRVSA